MGTPSLPPTEPTGIVQQPKFCRELLLALFGSQRPTKTRAARLPRSRNYYSVLAEAYYDYGPPLCLLTDSPAYDQSLEAFRFCELGATGPLGLLVVGSLRARWDGTPSTLYWQWKGA